VSYSEVLQLFIPQSAVCMTHIEDSTSSLNRI